MPSTLIAMDTSGIQNTQVVDGLRELDQTFNRISDRITDPQARYQFWQSAQNYCQRNMQQSQQNTQHASSSSGHTQGSTSGGQRSGTT